MTSTILNLDAFRAVRLAQEVARYGGLAQAIGAASADAWTARENAPVRELLNDLLAEKVRIAEEEDPSLKAARLIQGANAAEASAKTLFDEAAEWAGKAAMRFLRAKMLGDELERDLGDSYQRRADATTKLAEANDARAVELRMEAAAILSTLNTVQMVRDAITDAMGGFSPTAA